MSSEHGVPGLLDGYYQEGGPATHDADIMLTSLPVELLKEYHIEAGKAIAIKDKVLLDGLTKAGFKLNPYPGSLFLKYFRDGGGYYIVRFIPPLLDYFHRTNFLFLLGCRMFSINH